MSKVLHLTEVTDKLQEKIDALEHKSAEGLKQAALFVGGEAQQRAPIESGDLRNSMKVTFDSETSAKVSFCTPYAAKQHEDLTLNHDRTDGYKRPDGTTVNMIAGGQAKYLESVLVEKQSEILRIIAGEMGFDGGDDYD